MLVGTHPPRTVLHSRKYLLPDVFKLLLNKPLLLAGNTYKEAAASAQLAQGRKVSLQLRNVCCRGPVVVLRTSPGSLYAAKNPVCIRQGFLLLGTML